MHHRPLLLLELGHFILLLGTWIHHDLRWLTLHECPWRSCSPWNSIQNILGGTHHAHLILYLCVLLLLELLYCYCVTYKLCIHLWKRSLLVNDTHISQHRNVIVSGEWYGPRFREEPKPVVQRHLAVTLTVVVWAMWFLTSVAMEALLHFEELRVELLLFPSMTELAFVLILTAILVRCNEVFCVPVLAYFLCIAEDWRLTSIILPIVCIDAYISFMVVFSIGTPNCLKVEDVEVHIWLEFLN